MKNWQKGRLLVDIKCDHCGKMFERDSSEHNRSVLLGRAEYCSRKCAASKKWGRASCKNCGKQFNKTRDRKKFCSKSCSVKYLNKSNINDKERSVKIRLAQNKNYEKVKKEYYKNPKLCKNCNSPIKCELRGKRIFCSVNCRTQYARRGANGLSLYRGACSFLFSVKDYPDFFDLDLISKHGWYSAKNKGNNLNGVSRDHIYSVFDGYKNGIDPNIISHPANCKLVLQKDNSRKYKASNITIDELMCKINDWNNKYGEYGVTR